MEQVVTHTTTIGTNYAIAVMNSKWELQRKWAGKLFLLIVYDHKFLKVWYYQFSNTSSSEKNNILIQFLGIQRFHIPVIALKIVVDQMVLGAVITRILEIIVSIVDMLNAANRKRKENIK